MTPRTNIQLKAADGEGQAFSPHHEPRSADLRVCGFTEPPGSVSPTVPGLKARFFSEKSHPDPVPQGEGTAGGHQSASDVLPASAGSGVHGAEVSEKSLPAGPGEEIAGGQPSSLKSALAARVSPGTVIRGNEPLAKHTTLRVGGPVDVYIEPESEDDLAAVVKFCGERRIGFFILGRGSNLLARDGGFRGVAVCLAHAGFSRVEIDGWRLRCGAGAKLKDVAIAARRQGMSGMEFLEGIPGTVGGALRMNAGAMGGATFDVVESVRLMDLAGEVRELTPRDMTVDYRACATLKDHVALGAVFKGRPDSPESIAQRMSAFSQKRWNSQPAAPSAGCMFKNPDEVPAGKLIDELGLKGTRVGGAVVSQEHGNFIVNDGDASARDVLDLIELVRAKVKAARGVELQTEVEIIGEDPGR